MVTNVLYAPLAMGSEVQRGPEDATAEQIAAIVW